ncbi:DNA-3-methyladenine glycosylase II [Chitinophaga jiangningensis]|uniref:DNA-3-methyladenine glycosylase II n=1 Tax=Chitinophaga jiangningensis TaxID=1419482 RepID=A0A1M6Y1Y9_9BACT|nr:DNA-3-methyladenine glycosylase [Chitinophaga jiangningensis]SHL12250.1 DNA-3-methyladenine glycosylase II [Chitinophaga jiangningensis]
MKSQQILVDINDPGNFSFAACLVFLGRSDKENLHFIRNGTLQKLVVADGIPVLITVTGETGHQLIVEMSPVTFPELTERVPALTEKAIAYITRYVTRWLHLDGSLQSFYDYAAQNPLLSGLPERYKGLRLIGIPDLFETLCWTIIGQQINLTFAYTLRQRLITHFGYSVALDGHTFHLFPRPEVIAALTPEVLAGMQFSGGKARYLIATAQEIVNGTFSMEALDRMDYQQAKERLLALKGIGNWSANYILMKYGRFPEALPLEDAGLHNAIKARLQLEAKPTAAQLKEITGKWGQHAAYATFYLWRTLLPQ